MNDSITKAIKQVYNKMPDTFYAPEFCSKVRFQTFPKAPMDGTIMRILRHLRQQGKVAYKNISKARAQYKKVA